MGQYYKPINLANGQWLYSHDYGSGLKLMEHSWIGNQFVGVVMKMMLPGGQWHRKPIVWCGDYYSEEGEEDYYDQAVDGNKIRSEETLSEEEQCRAILVNHTTKEYVIYSKLPGDLDRWQINPLPLLTALGNGRGGGDYYDDLPDSDKVGIWAKHILSVEFEIPDGYTELRVRFRE